MSATVNRVGLPRDAYKGAATTLCAGCGHNSITNHMIKALYELGVEPHRLAKMSGIGCSSKTPAYFVESAHGFNGVHGRMPALTTGAQLANRQLIMLGVSGDGDTASIGLGQFMHMIRRNVDCTYIIEDNGTYGLTKGQFSATADLGSVQKKGAVNTFQPIDPCAVVMRPARAWVSWSFVIFSNENWLFISVAILPEALLARRSARPSIRDAPQTRAQEPSTLLQCKAFLISERSSGHLNNSRQHSDNRSPGL